MSAFGGKAYIFNRNACFSLNANTLYTRPIISAFSERPLKIYLVFCTAGLQLEAFLQHLGAGELSEAEGIYQQILKTDPNQLVALHLLSVIAHQVGKNDIAVDLITKALALKPDLAEAHSNLGPALQDLRKAISGTTNTAARGAVNRPHRSPRDSA